MVDVRVSIPRMKTVTKEHVNQAVIQLIYLFMLEMFQIQQFGLAPMEILMDLFAQKVVRLVMFWMDGKRIQHVTAM